MSDLPAIVVVGYDRPHSLARLLQTVRAGSFPAGVPLVISLDRADAADCADLAAGFDWPFGPKRLIHQSERLGLREHVLRCGDLSADYGAVILLEEDLAVAPHFYAWVQAAIAAYGGDDRIGGIALYSYRLNEFNNLDFEPADDGSDAYFLQVAASWGQAWTASQWRGFRSWYAAHGSQPVRVTDGVPLQLEAWRENSWKRFFIKYLTATGRTFVYPRVALSTNMADAGTNTKRVVGIYQVPLDLRLRDWTLRPLDRSAARYDVFYEPEAEVLRRLQPRLVGHDFDVDLFGTKPASALTRSLLLSSRPATGALLSFGLLGHASPEAAVVAGTPGRLISLAPRERFARQTLPRRIALARASQSGSPAAKVAFQILKPLQTQLTLSRKRMAARS